MSDPYEELGLSFGSTLDDIKKAYRQLSRKLHPDKMIKASAAEKACAEVKFTRIQAANNFLMDETQRGLYDAAEELKASSAKRKKEREGAMDDRRRAMKRRLDEQESAARKVGTQNDASSSFKTEADIRRANAARRDAQGAMHSQREASAVAEALHSREERENRSRRSVSVKWQRKVHSFSSDDLEKLFSPFGKVLSISFEGVKGNAAKVTFETPESASAAAATASTASLRVSRVGMKGAVWENPASDNYMRQSSLDSARDFESVEDYKTRHAAERDWLKRQMLDGYVIDGVAGRDISREFPRLRPPLTHSALAALEAEVFSSLFEEPR